MAALAMMARSYGGEIGKTILRSVSSNARPRSKRKVPKRKGEYLFGVAPCFAAMQAGRRKIHNIFLKEGMTVGKRRELKIAALEEVREYGRKHHVDIHHVDSDVLDRLSEKRPHQGIVLDASPLRFQSLDPEDHIESLKQLVRESEGMEDVRCPVWLALDEVQDPMNFGALLRCAFFLGVERVVATADRSCRLSPVVSKASAGAMELMPVYTVRNLARYLNECAEDGWEVLGACSPERHSSSHYSATARFTAPVASCHEYSLQRPSILVLGNEAHGLRRGVEDSCTTLLTIDPHRDLPLGFDSLNVSVAAGILLHNLQNPPNTGLQ